MYVVFVGKSNFHLLSVAKSTYKDSKLKIYHFNCVYGIKNNFLRKDIINRYLHSKQSIFIFLENLFQQHLAMFSVNINTFVL